MKTSKVSSAEILKVFPVGGAYRSTNTTQAGRGWPLGEEGVLEFTTTVSIIHRNGTDVFPYEECHGADCLGSIV